MHLGDHWMEEEEGTRSADVGSSFERGRWVYEVKVGEGQAAASAHVEVLRAQGSRMTQMTKSCLV